MSPPPRPELVRHFPDLRRTLPWTPLARPTRVHALSRLESYMRGSEIWVKRDDQTSEIHGGNEARKLEFVFGEALRRGSRRMLAFGSVGSSSGLAVAAFAHHFELRAILALSRRSSAKQVQRVLQLEHGLGAELHRVDGGPRALWKLVQSCLGATPEASSRLPYVLWPRRATLLGALGYVNAAYELHRQVACGILPEPECIYVAVRSGATLAGLALGCQLAGIRSRLVGVVADGHRPGSPRRLIGRACRVLRRSSRHFPAQRGPAAAIELRRGNGPRVAGPQARGLLRDLENLDLDATSTAPTMAALLDDRRAERVDGPVLFWQTHCPANLSRQPSAPAEALPREFHEFFAANS
ncbi:MAG: pyridoxal-phosphate dependent enzyme [Candidatus Latescibacterota bacterium]|nr:MAG: pyridoxal-phosphate dependent enzyme [Candidatus Latescibacterota bacterium]